MTERELTPQEREIRGLLKVALQCVEWDDWERVAWRLADAGGLVRELLETRGYVTFQKMGLGGLDAPTDRGALLPRLVSAQPRTSIVQQTK